MTTKAAQAAQLKKDKFLAVYARTGNLSEAARLTRTGRRTHYDWLAADPKYAAAFSDAQAEAGEALEAEARRRAVTGWSEPVWYLGEAVGTVRKFSDTLLIFLMKGAMPDKYRERRELVGKDGGPIETRGTVINVSLNDD